MADSQKKRPRTVTSKDQKVFKNLSPKTCSDPMASLKYSNMAIESDLQINSHRSSSPLGDL